MSLKVNLHTDLVSVVPNDRESLIEGLRSIAEFDNDFNGYNGTKSEVLAKFDVGLNSDIENVLHFLKDDKNDEDFIANFFGMFMASATDYYKAWEVKTLKNSEGYVIAVGFSCVYY